MTFKNKNVLLALANPPAEKWLAAKMEGAEVKNHPTDNGFTPDVILVAARSTVGRVNVGLDDPVKVVTRYVAHAPVVVVVAESPMPEMQQAGVSQDCFIFPESPGVPVRVSRVFSTLVELVKKDFRLEPVVFGNPAARAEPAEPVILENSSLLHESDTVQLSATMPDLSALVPFREKIVVFTCPGSGKTTLAASFTVHLSGLSEQVSLVDFGLPPALRLHLGKPELTVRDGWNQAETEWGTLYVPSDSTGPADAAALIGYLAQDGYVVIDAPSVLPGWLKEMPASIIDVIDDDMRKLEILKFDPSHLLVANRVPSASVGTWPHVVARTLGSKPDVVIEEDGEGVQSSLAGYLPAGMKSRAVSVGAVEVGKLLRERGVEA